MNTFKQELLTTAFENIAQFKDEKNAMDRIAKIVLDKGIDVVFDETENRFGQVLVALTPVQIMTLTKRLFKELVRTTYYESVDIQRQLESAVAYKGVDGVENPLSVVGIDNQQEDPYEKFNEYRAILDEMYPALSAAFTAAGNIVLRGRGEPLPWYTTANDDGRSYSDAYTYEDAERMIDRAREKAAEERMEANRQSLQALAGLDF